MIDDTAPPWKDTPHAAKIESPPCGGGAPMSAFGGRADVNHCVGECPLIATSGHRPHPKFSLLCGVKWTFPL